MLSSVYQSKSIIVMVRYLLQTHICESLPFWYPVVGGSVIIQPLETPTFNVWRITFTQYTLPQYKVDLELPAKSKYQFI